MTSPAPPDLFAAILACLCAELADNADENPPGYGPVNTDGCCATHGSDPHPADKCCVGDGGNGQAWVRTVSFQPRVISECGNAAVIDETIEVGVHRCAPWGGPNGEPVTCDARTRHAARMRVDGESIRRAVACCPVLKDVEWTFTSMFPLATQGGCSSWVYTFNVRHDEPCPITFGGPPP